MAEINFGGGDDSSSSSGSSGGLDISNLLDDLEEAEERIRNNPGLRKMFGIELEDMEGNNNSGNGKSSRDPHEVNEVGEENSGTSKDDLDADFLSQITGAMCQEGYGDFTLKQLHSFIENNPEQVNNIIEQNS